MYDGWRELYAFDRRVAAECGGPVAGVDEAGRGPLAGPVVAAAVCLDLHTPLEGLDDSKRLSASRREKLFATIEARAHAHGIGMADVAEIDTLNILRASLLAMSRAVGNLRRQASVVLVDGRECIPGVTHCPQRAVIGGDRRSASVAAASILAKVTRDRLMVDYDGRYPGYAFDRHKGYPTKQHRVLLARLGMCPIHRRSFSRKFVGGIHFDAA